MSKGLVSFKKALHEVSPVLRNGLGATPVNRQAAKVLHRAPDICKPMPCDPDLADRKIVVAYLKERSALMSEIESLKMVAKGLRKEAQAANSEIRRLQDKIKQLRETGEVNPEPDHALASPPQIVKEISSLSDQQLEATIEDLKSTRIRLADGPKFSWRAELVLRETQEQCELERSKRKTLIASQP